MKLLWTLILLGLTSAAPTKQIIQNTIGVIEYGLYVVNVTIGTPNQQFIVLLNTEINGLFIQDKSCRHCNHTFDSSKSSTYKFLSQNLSLGSASHIIGQDVVNLGLSPNLLPIPNTIIEQNVSPLYVDGLLGLGLQYNDRYGYIGNNTPILVNAYNQGVVDQPIYTIYLKKNIQNGEAGVITYGGVDSTNCRSVIAYQPLAKYDNYIIAFSGISYGSYVNSNPYTTLVDATSGYIAGPPSEIAKLAKVAGATFTDAYKDFYQVDCDKKLPSLTFTIGGKQYTVHSFAGLSYATQTFGLASSIADVFGYQPIDGIMGLGWPALAVDNVVPPIQNLLPTLDKPLFTVWMDRKVQVSMGGSGGLITYGALDTKNCDPTFNYVTLSSKTYWQFAIDSFSVGSYSISKSQQVISDTGTSWLGGPQVGIDDIAKATNAIYDSDYEVYAVPCTLTGLPDIVFTIGGMKYNIPSTEYLLDIGIGNGVCAITIFDFDFGGFGPQWILGDTFIRTYCNAYDVGGGRIGFSKAHHTSV